MWPELSASRPTQLLVYSHPDFSRGSLHRTTGRAASDAIAAALPIVRLILGITLLLLGLGSLSCQVESSIGEARAAAEGPQWVRTVSGWERSDLWDVPEPFVPRLHPLVVAAGQGLVSVMGLVVCAGDVRPRRREPG